MAKRRRKASSAKMTMPRANGSMHGNCCNGPGWGLVLLIVGVLFLLQDTVIWNFWNLSWWTVVFIVFGLGALLKKH